MGLTTQSIDSIVFALLYILPTSLIIGAFVFFLPLYLKSRHRVVRHSAMMSMVEYGYTYAVYVSVLKTNPILLLCFSVSAYITLYLLWRSVK